MIVVSDASPLVNLGRNGKLGLLHDLYGDIVVPEEETKPILDDLRYKAGFRVSDDLYNRILEDAGER